MLALIEVGLTIAAWRNGWGKRALLPLAIGGGIAFILGFMAGLARADVHAAAPLFAVFDLACIATLAVMAKVGPADATEEITYEEGAERKAA